MLAVNPEKRTVTVEHANIIKRHTRAESAEEHPRRHSGKGRPGAHLERDAGLPGMRQALRASGHTTLPDGTKVRVCRRCNTTFEN